MKVEWSPLDKNFPEYESVAVVRFYSWYEEISSYECSTKDWEAANSDAKVAAQFVTNFYVFNKIKK